MPQVSEGNLVEELALARRELAEALERQAAFDEVLRLVASSSADLRQVFDTMLARATQLCAAKFGTMYLCEGDGLRTVALHDVPPAFGEERRRNQVIRPRPGTILGRALATRQPVQIADLAEEVDRTGAPSGHTGATLASLAGARTLLSVPMLRGDEPVGAIIIFRQEVRPFTEAQIALVTSFAAQAVIAIENTRLLNELRESLQEQTATAEVLSVISSSPGELEPVFQAMLANANPHL